MSEKPKAVPRQQSQRPPRVRLDSLKNPQPRAIPGAKAIPRSAQVQAHRTAVISCTNKACPKSDVREEDGLKICHECGTVVDESQITSEVTFGETSSGAAAVQGTYVGADQSHARNNALGGSKIAGGMDSREITEANGRRYINQLAAALQIAGSYVESGMQVYKLAYGINFIQGRRTKHVAAVCLYIACRRSKESRIMLIDFADILMVNVFKLGHVFNNLVQDLCLKKKTVEKGGIDVINPEALILRFAARLEFGDKTHRVAEEAIKVLQRMDRDWMTIGRRPAGVCGAALILAARMNNFRRTVREVVYIVKVTDITIHKRLEEFKVTESSALTVAEFRHRGDKLEHACDPPAFYEQFQAKKKRRKRNAKNLDDELPSDDELRRSPTAGPSTAKGQLQTPVNTQQAQTDSQAMPPPPIPIDPALLKISAQRLSELQSSQAFESNSNAQLTTEPQPARKRGRPAGRKNKPIPTPTASQVLDEQAIEADITSVLSDPTTIAHASALHQALEATESGSPNATQQHPLTSTTPDGENSVLESTEPNSPPPTQQPNSQPQPQPPRAPISDSEEIDPSEFADDPEVQNCKLTPAEVEIKERIWVHENADYLRARQAKLYKQQLAEENGTARPIVRRKRKRGRMGDVTPYQTLSEDGQIVPQSPLVMMERMLDRRGFSTKLNYGVLGDIYKDQASPSGGTSRSVSVVGNTGTGAGGEVVGSRAGTPLVTVTAATSPASPEQTRAGGADGAGGAGGAGGVAVETGAGATEADIGDDAGSEADDYVDDEITGTLGAIVNEMDEALEDDYVDGYQDEGMVDGEDDGEQGE